MSKKEQSPIPSVCGDGGGRNNFMIEFQTVIALRPTCCVMVMVIVLFYELDRFISKLELNINLAYVYIQQWDVRNCFESQALKKKIL